MKKIVYLLVLFTGIANAQVVNIPDANFKAKLLAADVTNQIAYGNGGYMKIDANNDGQIQETEVSSVDSLNVNTSNIIDLNGISSFTTLKNSDLGQGVPFIAFAIFNSHDHSFGVFRSVFTARHLNNFLKIILRI